MIRVEGVEAAKVKHHFEVAAKVAAQATCLRAKCGSVVVSRSGEIIGRGYNAPPRNDETQRRCNDTFDLSSKPKYDKTCCVHAEWNAVLDASRTSPELIEGATLYFMRIDENGDFTDAGDPYCTVCSRLTMESGIEKFALWNGDGFDLYDLPEYNALSYEYHKV